jgi:acyl-CoA thioesterase-1
MTRSSTLRTLMRCGLALAGALLALAARAGEAPAILVVGDSLSAAYGIALEEGWVALLERRLHAQGYGHRVVNASVSGETSRGAAVRLPQLLSRHDPAVVVIEIGGNDGLRGLPVAELRRNLTAMLEAARAAGAGALVLGMRIPPNYGPRYTEEFQAVFGEVAGRYGAGLVPFVLEDIALDAALMQEDGIHPRAAAQPLILDRVWARLEPLLKEARAAGARAAPGDAAPAPD